MIKRVLAATHALTTGKKSDNSLEEVRGDSVASDFMDLFARFVLMKDCSYQIAVKNAKQPYPFTPTLSPFRQYIWLLTAWLKSIGTNRPSLLTEIPTYRCFVFKHANIMI